MSNNREPKPIDLRFVLGFILIVFLALVHTLIGEIPLYLIAIPTIIMGVDLSAIVEAWRNGGKK